MIFCCWDFKEMAVADAKSAFVLQDRYMARDAAELKEVLQSVSDMLKPFYAQVIFLPLQPSAYTPQQHVHHALYAIHYCQSELLRSARAPPSEGVHQ